MSKTNGKLVPLVNSVRQLPAGSKALRRTPDHRWVELTVGVRRKQKPPELSSLDKLLPGQRKYSDRKSLTERFGSDPQAVTAITSFAKANGLSVTRDARGSAQIGIAGTAAQLSKAFGVQLFDYTHPTLGDFHARTGPIEVPASVASAITGVFGFNNHRMLRRRKQSPAAVKTMASGRRSWFVPTQLAEIYSFPNADLTKQTVGILEFGGGVSTADVTDYFAKLGIAAPKVEIVSVDGVQSDPTGDPDSTGEVMLDIDMVGALAPGATIVAYFSTFDEKGLVDCVGAIMDDSTNDPSVVSISWGWDENQPMNNQILWSPDAITQVNEQLLLLAHLGTTVCVSTGDDGSEAQIEDGRAHVNFPASSPYVLAVGGTTLHVRKLANGSQQIVETVWNDGPGSGTGGGVSDYTPVPAWQEGIVPPSINPGHFAGRAIPDVAANADPATGYLSMSGGKLGVVGGTSAAAPLWASLIARMNSTLDARVGNFNALLYSQIGPAGVLRDVTEGNNDTDGLLDGQYAAGPGWDACTGWGTPDGQKLLQALSPKSGRQG
jgi:kumamolisin